MPQKVDELFWELGANTAPLLAGVGKAQRSIAGLAKNMLSLKGALVGIGVVGALAFLKATSAAAKLDKPLREVSTLLPQTVEQMGELRKEIIALSTRVPQPPEQLTKGLYQVISAGVTDTAEAMDLLEVAATAATAGLATSQDAVLAITTVLNAYQLSASEAARISDIFFATIAQGVITFPEIASSIGRMATSASLAGISVEEMGAALATMTKAGISAAEATTALNRLFLEIINGKLGDEFDLSAVAADGFAATMNKLEEATRGDVKALSTLVKSEEAFRAASVLAGTQNAEFNRILDETTNSAGSTQIAFEKMTGSLQDQATLLKNKVNAFWLRLGEFTLPLVTQSLETLNFFLGETAKVMRDISGFNLETLDAEIAGVNVRFRSQLKIVDDLKASLEERSTARRRLTTSPELREAEETLRATSAELQALRQRRLDLRREPPTVPTVPGAPPISEEIQSLREALATQLQDELVAITATAVDDMELQFTRLFESIIAGGEGVSDEWQVVLDDMREKITSTGLAEEFAKEIAAVGKEIDAIGEPIDRNSIRIVRLSRQLSVLADSIIQSGLSAEDMEEQLGELDKALAALMAVSTSGGIEDLGDEFGALLDTITLMTRAIAELGQGFGFLGRDAASAINSIVTVAQGVQGIFAATASGASIAGPVGAIAGGLSSLIFGGGPSAQEVERLRVLKANNEALERLTNAMTASVTKGAAQGGLVAAGISAIGGAGTLEQGIGPASLNRRLRETFEAQIGDALFAAGFTMEQLGDLAEQMGLTLDGTAQSWGIFLEALQAVEAANLFEGFAGGMRRMRLEWELTDTIDPVKKLKDAREAFKKLTDGIEAPKNAEEVIALFNAISRGDLTGIGKLSPNDALELLQLIESLLDEAGAARGTTTSFAVTRSITEVTGNRLAGLLTTDVFWNEQTALNTAGILDALGGQQGRIQTPTSAELNRFGTTINGDVTFTGNFIIGGGGDPFATGEAVFETIDRVLGERLRDTRRAQGRQQTQAFRA